MTDSTKQNTVSVWDAFVRVGHWVLVVAFAVAYLTEGEPRVVHTVAGYVIATYVVARIVWGFMGPRHARFASFVGSPVPRFGICSSSCGAARRGISGIARQGASWWCCCSRAWPPRPPPV